MQNCQSCCAAFIAGIAIWWLVTSTLVFFTWNKILVGMTKFKPWKFWQALLMIATLLALLGPVLGRKHMGCAGMSGCDHGRGPCPYSAEGK